MAVARPAVAAAVPAATLAVVAFAGATPVPAASSRASVSSGDGSGGAAPSKRSRDAAEPPAGASARYNRNRRRRIGALTKALGNLAGVPEGASTVDILNAAAARLAAAAARPGLGPAAPRMPVEHLLGAGLPHAVCVFDMRGTAVGCNEAFRLLLGYSHVDVAARQVPIERVARPADAAVFRTVLAAAVEGRLAHARDLCQWLHRDETALWVSVTSAVAFKPGWPDASLLVTFPVRAAAPAAGAAARCIMRVRSAGGQGVLEEVVVPRSKEL